MQSACPQWSTGDDARPMLAQTQPSRQKSRVQCTPGATGGSGNGHGLALSWGACGSLQDAVKRHELTPLCEQPDHADTTP